MRSARAVQELSTVDAGVRACGECSACCTVLGVRDLDTPKPDYQRCLCLRDATENLRGGCGMYADRPPSCRAYACGWLQGWGEEGDRPDKLGLILEPWRAPPDGGDMGIVAREVWPGAFESEAARKLLEPIEKRTLIYVIRGVKLRMCVGPLLRLRAIEHVVQSARAKG